MKLTKEWEFIREWAEAEKGSVRWAAHRHWEREPWPIGNVEDDLTEEQRVEVTKQLLAAFEAGAKFVLTGEEHHGKQRYIQITS